MVAVFACLCYDVLYKNENNLFWEEIQMKRRFIAGIEIFFATAAVLATVTAFGAAGSEDDPLVSKSYVDDKINQVIEDFGLSAGLFFGDEPKYRNLLDHLISIQ